MTVPRVVPVVNQLADAVVAALEKINTVLDAGLWLTHPEVVQRGLLVNATMVRAPAMLVHVARWEDAPFMALAIHRIQADIEIHLVSAGDELAEKLLIDMAADVAQAIAGDETILGMVLEPPVLSYRGEGEVMQQTGLGVGTVTFTALCEWAHGAP